jgi:predicted SprT family Zn-dependent metalloprotease
MKAPSITQTEYGAFQKAYNFLNDELFGGALPNILVTLQRRGRAHGCFSADRFSNREADISVHEIALNPDAFVGRTNEEIISTLAHEMVHLWQHAYGKPGRRGYHNRQWAKKMKEIGLQPSDTGEENGKEIGESVSHYIVSAGPFAKAYRRLEARGIQLHWQSAPRPSKSKTKFSCPVCKQNAWAKPDAQLLCGACNGAKMRSD